MTLQQLIYFREVAETLNFTRASKNLNVTQSTLSYSIIALERELELVLCPAELHPDPGSDVSKRHQSEYARAHRQKSHQLQCILAVYQLRLQPPLLQRFETVARQISLQSDYDRGLCFEKQWTHHRLLCI